ncbi:uncharacterized protein DEA37_0002292 [Paragonimus westermani]|uniref:Uncharacterized protein n=1 Tax=Paragonimus westermani TaxID=34504 RepID=A0A5J4N639_9TREM|nr:uncharacterized protein DEA37_0002292 [Paragonimus westermani]
MDAMEKSHALESSIVSSLFDARQLIWTELSSVISNIKDQFDRSNKERAGDIARLLDENQSLTEVLNRLQEIAEGKEIEIHGLRRQLQSFYAGQPMCSVCTREIKAPTGKCSIENKCYLTDKRSSVRKSCPCHPCVNAVLEARKRGRSDSTFSSAHLDASVTPDELSKPKPSRWRLTMDSRPSTKRRCVRASVRAVSTNPDTLVCNKQKSNPDDRDNGKQTSVPDSSDKKPCGQPVESVGKSCTVSPKLCTFPAVDFSPPTEQYDASSAIKNAINHLDLVTCDDTQLDSVISYNAPATTDTTDDQSSITLSASACQTSKFFFRRASVAKGRYQRVASQLLHHRLSYGLSAKRHGRVVSRKGHRATSRHLQEKDCTEPNQKRNLSRFNKLDETDAELTLTSNFLESERTEVASRSPPVNLFPNIIHPSTVQLERDFGISEKHLPSVGGSPTNRSQSLFKRPEVPPPGALGPSFVPSPQHAMTREPFRSASLPVDDVRVVSKPAFGY